MWLLAAGALVVAIAPTLLTPPKPQERRSPIRTAIESADAAYNLVHNHAYEHCTCVNRAQPGDRDAAGSQRAPVCTALSARLLACTRAVCEMGRVVSGKRHVGLEVVRRSLDSGRVAGRRSTQWPAVRCARRRASSAFRPSRASSASLDVRWVRRAPRGCVPCAARPTTPFSPALAGALSGWGVLVRLAGIVVVGAIAVALVPKRLMWRALAFALPLSWRSLLCIRRRLLGVL